jgi:glutamate--cysteine ligase
MFKNLVDRSFLNQSNMIKDMPSLYSILSSAIDMGVKISYKSFSDDRNVFCLEKDGSSMYISRGNAYSNMRSYGESMAADKYRTYEVLCEAGIETPKTYFVDDNMDLVGKHVVKPRFGSKGEGISILDAIEINKLDDPNKVTIVQDFAEGYDLRIQAVGGKLFAACIREPANVTGDGLNRIVDLISVKNHKKLKQNRIRINDDLKTHIAEFGYGINDILANEEKLYLTKLSNISLGGDIWDVTDELDFSYHDLISKIGGIYRERNFAVDLVVRDHKVSCE